MFLSIMMMMMLLFMTILHNSHQFMTIFIILKLTFFACGFDKILFTPFLQKMNFTMRSFKKENKNDGEG